MNVITFEQGWNFIQQGITKLKNILEGLPEPQFTSEEYMMLYTTIFNMCSQKPPHDYSPQLYDKYQESLQLYITSTVLPCIREKHDEFLLREFVRRWSNHKVMTRWLTQNFKYLDRYFILRRSLPPLNDVAFACFRNLVYAEVKGKVRDAVIFLCLKREKDGVLVYLHSSSEPKLLQKVQHELLSVYATQLLQDEHFGFHALLRDDKVVDLSRMYRLFSKIPRGLAHLNLSDDDVVRVLHSLSCAKYKILIKEPNTKTISPTDIFEFNSKFTDKMRRIKIPLGSVDEKKKVIEDVDKHRWFAIDASVVRIMKSRKVLGYQQLLMECIEQLSSMFRPDVRSIKKRIEVLITREYLERDKENPNIWIDTHSTFRTLEHLLGSGFTLPLHHQKNCRISMNEGGPINLEEGWGLMQKGITKLKNILEDIPEVAPFSSQEYMELYQIVFNMCTQKPPHDYSQQLYDKYRETIEEYITSMVLPSLREKHDEFMLKEFVRRWSNHKVMVMWLSRFFHYLDRYFIIRYSLRPLKEVGLACFRDLVYGKVKGKVTDAVISLIDQEREGEQIDQALLKNVLDIFVEIGMEYYVNDFEVCMLKDTTAYYSRKASNWILEDSCPDYMIKAEESLKREKDNALIYLHGSSEQKLLEKVQHELLSVYATQLLENEHSGFHALLRDGKAVDLSRMCRLFSKIPRGLDLVSSMFKQHVTAEGRTLVKHAEDAASNTRAEKRDEVALQVFVRKVFEHQDKYLACVNNCVVFHKALGETFETFCSKVFAGSSSAEVLATFCDNILKKGGCDKLSDEAVEDTFEKVVRQLAVISDKDLFAEFYRIKLARRLLFDKSANDEHERSLLTKMKQQFGSPFTSKIEGMVSLH
ncbi:hypothetical protein M8C21_000333 [Ambrosia artemisiifolia]|uniref:Cullin family profile domain-containing protein n=1 Tax=Ambrosia artemisiifolia TaxID=4212 RepID=A0AAD5CXA7_AMBAR|nr:hypothetical protein M8C21_000333 [Ambrosia artemisiifolia]